MDPNTLPPPYEITQHDPSHPFHNQLHQGQTVNFTITLPINADDDNGGDHHPTTIQCILTQYTNAIHVILTQTGALSSFFKIEADYNNPKLLPQITQLQGVSCPQYLLLARALMGLFSVSGRPVLLSVSLSQLFNLKPNEIDDDFEWNSSDKANIRAIVDSIAGNM